MNSRTQLVRADASARARSPAAVRAMLIRFDAPLRRRIEAEVGAHAYFEDLLFSFPAVLAALAGQGNAHPHNADAVRSLVRAGAPLRTVAHALGLPLWTRALQPEAFVRGVPVLPDTRAFAAQVVNFLPRHQHAARWLEFVAEAYRWGDEELAFWAARGLSAFHGSLEADVLQAIGLFVWFSKRPQLAASACMPRRWHVDMSPLTAAEAAIQWIDVVLASEIWPPVIAYRTACTFVDGFAFECLETINALIAEGSAMNNCVATYADQLTSGRYQIWGMRRHGQPVADLQIEFAAEAGGMPKLIQLLGPGNASVSSDVLHAAYRWLLAWPLAGGPLAASDMAGAKVRYRALMKPYWLAKGRCSWLPFEPDDEPLGLVRNQCDRVRGARWQRVPRRRRRRG